MEKIKRNDFQLDLLQEGWLLELNGIPYHVNNVYENKVSIGAGIYDKQYLVNNVTAVYQKDFNDNYIKVAQIMEESEMQ